jgi:hypothetical protein
MVMKPAVPILRWLTSYWLTICGLLACAPTTQTQTVFGTTLPTTSPSSPSAPTPSADSPNLPNDPSTGDGTLIGTIYFLEPESTDKPVFTGLQPVGRVGSNQLDIPSRSFDSGFPGITNRFEWFGIEYRGICQFTSGGTYGFRLESDDGARLYINETLVIQNDGIHPSQSVSGKVTLTAGRHSVRLPYFQGPRTEIALRLFVTPPGGTETIFQCRK